MSTLPLLFYDELELFSRPSTAGGTATPEMSCSGQSFKVSSLLSCYPLLRQPQNLYGLAVDAITVLVASPVAAGIFYKQLRQPRCVGPRCKHLLSLTFNFCRSSFLSRIFSCKVPESLHQKVCQFMCPCVLKAFMSSTVLTAFPKDGKSTLSKFEDTKISIDGLVVTLNSFLIINTCLESQLRHYYHLKHRSFTN